VSSFHATIALAEQTWRDLVADEKTPGAGQVREFADDPNADGITFPLTPAARLAVESIRRCPFGGACREMALTARCHDLLIEFLTTLSTLNAHAPRPVTLTQGLEQHVRAAAQRLAQNLETPPTVAELARSVGLSETTLKRGFHQVFNATIFGYLRGRRMERAHEALQSGAVTVLEAAALVGYSNPSNFAAAFRRQFGVNPKTFQLAVRR
jgi:AraC family transcriptional regulator, transcriptional activator of the genes for pyochelin and ferripyochelin receptors